MRIVTSLLQLARPYSTLLAFLSVLVPVFVRTSDIALSVERALPLLFISICTFVSNDLDDIDKDRINHPERPLPRGHILPSCVATFYFFSLALALLTTRYFIPVPAAFLYYLLLILCISYHYVVDYLPAAKAAYVAAASCLPLLILAAFYPAETALYIVAVAEFAFMLGREICKDILDRDGDPDSILHRIPAARMAAGAFAMQSVALILLTPLLLTPYRVLEFAGMTLLLACSYVLWFRADRRRTATAVMKANIFLGLSFLV